jgi:DNA polymerase III delta prime subunit
MIEKLIWEKYRPQNFKELILFPRIQRKIKQGLNSSIIISGPFGTGKTSLARLLTKDKNVLYKNTSLNTSIEVLRGDIQDFVDSIGDIFSNDDGYRYVFLDEFEEASPQYQNALKAFIEEYSNRVKFIFVSNHVSKIDGGLWSRSTHLDFTPQNQKEEKWLKLKYKERLSYIKQKEQIECENQTLKNIVINNFPDFRKMVVSLSDIRLSGKIEENSFTGDEKLTKKIYSLLKEGTTIDLQNFIIENFGAEKIQSLFNILGRPLIEIIIYNDKKISTTDLLGDIYSIVSEYSQILNTIRGGDPIVVGTGCLHQIQKKIKYYE